LAFRSHVISEEKAKGARKVLRWIKEAAPRKREKEEAAGLLKILEGVGEKGKQVLLTRGQEEMLSFVLEEFPVVEPTQLSLFSPQEEYYLSQTPTEGGSLFTPPTHRKLSSKSIRPDQSLPEPYPASRKPVLKSELTVEDKQERGSIGLSSTPGEVPLDSEGVPTRKRITEAQERLATRDRQFGKVKEVKVEE